MNKMHKINDNKNLFEQHSKRRKSSRDNLECKEQELKLEFKNYQSNFYIYFSSHASELKKFKASNGIKA